MVRGIGNRMLHTILSVIICLFCDSVWTTESVLSINENAEAVKKMFIENASITIVEMHVAITPNNLSSWTKVNDGVFAYITRHEHIEFSVMSTDPYIIIAYKKIFDHRSFGVDKISFEYGLFQVEGMRPKLAR